MKTFVMALAVLGVAEVAFAQCSTPYFVEQRFPTTGTEETRWRICWQNQGKHGLVITAAFFRKSPSAPFVRVFWDARLAEIFVPYHAGQPRFLEHDAHEDEQRHGDKTNFHKLKKNTQ